MKIQEVLNLIAKEDYGNAQEELKKMIAANPNKNELYNLYAYCEKCITDICENEDFEVEPQPEKPKNKTEICKEMYEKAISFADKGDYKKALSIFEIIWDAIPLKETEIYWPSFRQPRAKVLEDMAKCYFLLGDMENAKNKFLQSIDKELSVRDKNSYYRVPFLLKKKDYTEAFRLFDFALIMENYIDKPDIYYERYNLHKTVGNTENLKYYLQQTLTALETVLSVKPLDYNLYKKYADLLTEKGDYPQALLENAKAIALWPEFYGFHLQRAEIYAHMGKKDKALEILNLLEKGSFHRINQYHLSEQGKAYEIMGDLKTAEEYYLQEKSSPRLYYDVLYDFYQRQNRKEDIEKLRQEQRKEQHFQDRISESELTALI